MTELDIVASTTEPALAVDVHATILDWNEGATQLFGYPRTQVLGGRCWEVLCGRDLFGNEYCSEECPLIRMAKHHDAISRCELYFRTASCDSLHVGVSTMAFGGRHDGEVTIIHVFTPLQSSQASAQEVTRNPLTGREIEVLRLLGIGKKTPEIAEVVAISEATVRNHIHQILAKLNAHNRLEAVCIGWRMGLIEPVQERTNG